MAGRPGEPCGRLCGRHAHPAAAWRHPSSREVSGPTLLRRLPSPEGPAAALSFYARPCFAPFPSTRVSRVQALAKRSSLWGAGGSLSTPRPHLFADAWNESCARCLATVSDRHRHKMMQPHDASTTMLAAEGSGHGTAFAGRPLCVASGSPAGTGCPSGPRGKAGGRVLPGAL